MKVDTIVEGLKGIKGNSDPLFFILGPCVIESELHVLKMAEALKKLSEKLKFTLIFKSSYDKANRTSLSGFRGLGIAEGARILSRVREEFELPIVTDIHESHHAEVVAEFSDILQIPAFLSRQTDLLIAAGNTGKIVNVKKAQFMAPQNIKGAITKIETTKNTNVWLCERGFAFGYNDWVVDYRSFPIMKSFEKPVVFDVTHSIAAPGGLGHASGGDRRFAPPLAVSAVAQGIAGIFMEVHDEPDKAPCDGPNSVRLSLLENMLKYLIELDQWTKARKQPEMW